ncbi:MAG: hypothetical protein MH825_11215 [Cyanobacteria bacterium]|nr:hypothetical protein [Cyanobacteriota bacterium]
MSNWCFGTLAVGKRYRQHAINLVQDAQLYAPNIPIIVLTDKPEDFVGYPAVQAIKHRLQSVKGYHDKRFVIQAALLHFDTCLFIDSDVRILGQVPEQLSWEPGITARAGCNILKHNSRKNQRRILPLLEHVSNKLDIDLEKTYWLHEFMFAVTRQGGVELEFLKLWQTISYFFEMQSFYGGEGNTIGLASSKTGFNMRLDSKDRFPVFKDNIEKFKIKNNQSSFDDKKEFFEAHEKIEFPKRSFRKKVTDKLTKHAVFAYRIVRLKFVARKDANLQRLL